MKFQLPFGGGGGAQPDWSSVPEVERIKIEQGINQLSAASGQVHDFYHRISVIKMLKSFLNSDLLKKHRELVKAQHPSPYSSKVSELNTLLTKLSQDCMSDCQRAFDVFGTFIVKLNAAYRNEPFQQDLLTNAKNSVEAISILESSPDRKQIVLQTIVLAQLAIQHSAHETDSIIVARDRCRDYCKMYYVALAFVSVVELALNQLADANQSIGREAGFTKLSIACAQTKQSLRDNGRFMKLEFEKNTSEHSVIKFARLEPLISAFKITPF